MSSCSHQDDWHRGNDLEYPNLNIEKKEASGIPDLAPKLAGSVIGMVYENSGCTAQEIKTMHTLVAQVSRAFFDPHFVIIMDRMMSSDM